MRGSLSILIVLLIGIGCASGAADPSAGPTVHQAQGSGAGASSPGPKVIPGPVTAEGSLSKPVVGEVLRSRIDETKACYLDVKSAEEGRLELRFIVAADGSVRDLETSEEGGLTPSLVECVASGIRSLRFPPAPEGGSTAVTYAMKFRPDRR